MVLGKTLESPLDSKEIKTVNPKGNQPWIFIGRTAAEAQAPILWPPDAKSQIIGKDPGARKDWGQKEINPEHSLEGLMVKLKLQYFGHLMWRTDSLEKTLMLGKTEGKRKRGWQRLDGITDSMDMSLSKLLEIAKVRGLLVCSSGLQRGGHNLVTEQQH